MVGVQRAKDTSNLLVASVQPSNAVKSRLDVIVFILAFKAVHRRFTCRWCPNLNLRQLSESESEANSTHAIPWFLCYFPQNKRKISDGSRAKTNELSEYPHLVFSVS